MKHHCESNMLSMCMPRNLAGCAFERPCASPGMSKLDILDALQLVRINMPRWLKTQVCFFCQRWYLLVIPEMNLCDEPVQSESFGINRNDLRLVPQGCWRYRPQLRGKSWHITIFFAAYCWILLGLETS